VKRLALFTFVLLCVAAPAQAAGPRILTIGDSMMRGVDRNLEKRLAQVQKVSFRSHVLIGEGITNEPWVRISLRQARKHRPRATVAFMGANDGYDMVGASCCGKAWVDKYVNRVSTIIRIFSRKGRGDVYWLTLPAAESGRRRQLFPKINDAIRAAVQASGPHAHVVNVASVLTPGRRYRSTMSWNGEEVQVRHADGVHLSGAGAGIAADVIRDAMVKDGVVG